MKIAVTNLESNLEALLGSLLLYPLTQQPNFDKSILCK